MRFTAEFRGMPRYFLVICAAAALCLPAPCRAENPEEQAGFMRLLGDLMESPGDPVVRGGLIVYANGMDPRPRLPAEARKNFVKAASLHMEASKRRDFELAAEYYADALKLAPWWGPGYCNLAAALRSAGDLPGAGRAGRFCELSRSAVKKSELAAAGPGAPAADFSGEWGNGLDCWRYAFEVSGRELKIRMHCWDFDGAEYGSGFVAGRRFEGSSKGGPTGTGVGYHAPLRFRGELGADGRTIELHSIIAPELAEDQAALDAAVDQAVIFGGPAWQKQLWRRMGPARRTP